MANNDRRNGYQDNDSRSSNYNSRNNDYRDDRNYYDWNRNYNDNYDRSYNNENRNSYPGGRDRDYQNNRNEWNSNFRNRSNDWDNYRAGNEYYNNRYRNEGWRDNYRDEDRDWWDRTKDEVSSWFGDDDAKRRRRMDELREGQHRGKGPKNYSRSSERIKEDASDRLSDDAMVDASNIDIEVNGNELTLTGTVDTRYEKHRAEELVENVSGVSHVQNNLRVSSKVNTENSGSSSNSYTGSMGANSNLNTSSGNNKNRKDAVNS